MSPPRLVYRIMTPLEWKAAHEVGLVPRRDIDALADHLKWELAPKRGLEFPHFYGDLTMADMVAARYLVRKDGAWHYDETRSLSW